ncbi:hypothetical protein HYX17_02485 [Candidatus Woesearchaeota archaeon]|nr:hypothetical protein [Candidatus Woesearchaeota archaeon]
MKFKILLGIFFIIILINIYSSEAQILRLIGEPKILVCQEDIELVSLAYKEVKFVVQNQAENNANFNAFIVCEDDSHQEIFPSRIQFKSDEIETIQGRVSFGTQEDKSVSCIFTVQDLNNPDNKDSCNFNVNVKPRPIDCDIGDTICRDNDLYACESGTKFVKIKTCELGCEETGKVGVAKCKGEQLVTNKSYQKKESNYIIPSIIIAFAIIIGAWIIKRKRK